MPKTLADGRIRLALLTAAPTVPALPTTTQLNAGIGTTTGITCNVAHSDFVFGAVESDTFQDRALCDPVNVEGFGASNYQAAMTVYRFYNASTGAIESAEDILYTAVKTKGTRLWLYMRHTQKLSSAAFAVGDELFGAEILTDLPQKVQETSGYIKYRVPMKVQAAYHDIVLAA